MEEDAKCGLADCPPYWGKIIFLFKPVPWSKFFVSIIYLQEADVS
jgi:hypothetical protein